MKKQIVALLAGAMLMVASSAMAIPTTYTVGSTNVGEVDTLLASADLGNSGAAGELAWVNGATGKNYSSIVSFSGSLANWEATDTAHVFALDLLGTPDYYFIKTGSINGGNQNTTPQDDHFLFTNVASLEWAVLNFNTSFGEGYVITDFGKFSHLGEAGGSTPVPEPGTMMLLGIGMLGMAVFGKRRMNKA